MLVDSCIFEGYKCNLNNCLLHSIRGQLSQRTSPHFLLRQHHSVWVSSPPFRSASAADSQITPLCWCWQLGHCAVAQTNDGYRMSSCACMSCNCGIYTSRCLPDQPRCQSATHSSAHHDQVCVEQLTRSAPCSHQALHADALEGLWDTRNWVQDCIVHKMH